MASNPEEVRKAAIAELARRELARRQSKKNEFVGPPVSAMNDFTTPAEYKDAAIGAADVGISSLRGMVNRPAIFARALAHGVGGAVDPNDTFRGAYERAKESGREQIEAGQGIVRSERLRTPQGQETAEGLGNALRSTGIPQGVEWLNKRAEQMPGGWLLKDALNTTLELAPLPVPRMMRDARTPRVGVSPGAPRQIPAEPVVAAQGGSAGAAASAAGSAASQASPALQLAVAKLEQSGKPINLEALSRYVDADTLPVPVKITRGEAHRDPVLISQERNMRGATPEAAQFYNERHKALVQNLSAMREQAGPNVFSTNVVEHGDSLISAYKEIDAAARAQIKQAYDAALAANGGTLPMDGTAFVSTADVALQHNMKARYVPREIAADMAEIRASGQMDFKTFENLRTNLAAESRKAERAGDGNAVAAIRIVRDALEKVEPLGRAAEVKPLFDKARSLAYSRFQALDADPAYKAAVDDLVPPDRFTQKFVIGGTRDGVAAMRKAFASNPQALETMSVAALDHLRDAAGIDAFGNGAFSQARFNKQITALDPKAFDLFGPKLTEQIRQLGNVARTIESDVAGSYVNRSNTFVAGAARAAEGAANYAAFGVPVGTAARRVIERATLDRQWQQALDPLVGLEQRAPKK